MTANEQRGAQLSSALLDLKPCYDRGDLHKGASRGGAKRRQTNQTETYEAEGQTDGLEPKGESGWESRGAAGPTQAARCLATATARQRSRRPSLAWANRP